MFKAIIFDMDGVIVDSEGLSLNAFTRALQIFDINPNEEDIDLCCGLSDKNIIEIMRKKYNKEIDFNHYISKKAEFYEDNVRKEGVHAFDGARDFVELVKNSGLQYIIASSGNHAKISYNLNKIGMTDLFDHILSGEDFHKSKPDPAIFLKAAEKLHLNPEDCLVLEDSINGVKAAKNAGMKCVAFTHTFKKEKLQEADLIIDGFHQLNLDTMKKLFN